MPPLDENKDENTEPELPLVFKRSIEVGTSSLGLVITVAGNMPRAKAEALYNGLAGFLSERCAQLFQREQLGFAGILGQEFMIRRGGCQVNVYAAIVNEMASSGGKTWDETSEDLAGLLRIIYDLVSKGGHSRLSPKTLSDLAPSIRLDPLIDSTARRRSGPPSGQSGRGSRGPTL